MSFDSISFWIVFALVWSLYWFLDLKKQFWLLFASSLFIYSTWNLKYTVLLGVLTALVYYIDARMETQKNPKKKKQLLLVSLSISVCNLLFFKYFLQLFPVSSEHIFLKTLHDWGLPIGISFYTFQMVGYTVDIYREKVKSARSVAEFFLYVAFFPQQAAGPIERAKNLLPQFSTEKKFNLQEIEQGFYLAFWGLFKKIYVSNGLLYPIQNFYLQQSPKEAASTILIFLLVTIQVYADFSGYSDMARGLAKMIGFKIAKNFKPFWFSKNPEEFWQRWHITLTTWLRDYVFLNIRNKRESNLIKYLKIIAVMTLVGLWHAPTINWLFFGIFNGVVIVLYSLTKRAKSVSRVTGLIFLFLLYFGNGLLHQTPSLHLIIENLQNLQNWNSFVGTKDLLLYSAWLLVPLFLVESMPNFSYKDGDFNLSGYINKFIFLFICIVGIFFLERSATIGFIYFRF